MEMRSLRYGEPSADERGGAASKSQAGLALVATLLVLAVMGVLVAAVARAVLTSTRTAGLEYHEARAFYAAEAGGEAALAQLKIALQDGYLSDRELSDIRPPTLPGFSFDSFSVERKGAPTIENITDGPFAGLYALTQNVDVYSVASDRNGTVSGVILRAKAQAIPIFQFGVFFEEDLEATNGPPMEFVGRVHSNGNIYLSSRNAWYRDMITTPNKVFHDRKDFHLVYDGVYINDASGAEVRLDFDSRTRPDPDAFKAESCAKFDCRLQTDAFGVDSLKLPLPDGVPPYELIRPREASDGDSEREVKFAWNADMYVTVDLATIRTRGDVCGGVDPTPWPRITVERSNGGEAPAAADLCRIFPWSWSSFYDARETELKDVLNIDVDELRIWSGGVAGRAAEVIYVEFVVPTDLGGYTTATLDQILDGTLDPALRVVNARELPNRMTVASEWPLYVLGDYNSFNKKPAALVGDGITILSNAWVDDQNRPPATVFTACQGTVTPGVPCGEYEAWRGGWTRRNAAETRVNAAILAGHWPTPCDHHDPSCPADGTNAYYQDWYGGGIENFPRFLERWRTSSGNRVVFHYLGALISPFTSQKTTGTWNGSYYVPPQRDWAFDTDFNDPSLLPPGTPNVGNVIRTAMREAF
jgi:type II secretory pathway pseudopilin PulG